MAVITPITREEFYLAKAGGQDVPVPSAVTREEYYLEKLSNDDIVVPTPVTRREKFLYFACGGEIDLPSEDKMTRLERLIAKAGGMDVSTPTAVTRLEKFWANVEGGGWKTITGVLPLTFTAKGGTAVDWVISGNAQGVGERTENKMPVPVNGVYSANRTTVTVTDGVYHIVQTEGSGSSSVYIDLPEFEVPDSGYINYLNSMAFASTTVVLRYNSESLSGGYALTPINRAVAIGSDYAGKKVNQIQIYTTGNFTMDFTIAPMMTDSNTYTTYIPYGYQIPLTVSQTGQPDKTYDIYIGDSPLTEGETVSKISTGVDIELFEGENTIDTSLYNKPEMEIKYK